MSYPQEPIKLEYRDKTLAPIEIIIYPPSSSPQRTLREPNTIEVAFFYEKERLALLTIVFSGEFLSLGNADLTWNVFWSNSTDALKSIAKWLLFHTDLANSENRNREYRVYQEEQDLRLSIRGDRLFCGVADDVMREEMKLGRIVALQMAYKHSLIHGFAPKTLILSVSHFPENVISAALDGMVAEGLATEPSSGSLRLSTSAQRQWERLGSMSQSAFIIGSCKPEYENVIGLIKEELSLEQLQPIFQEHEEPNKDIYIDIFDHLRDVPLVVADISDPRPNVFVEIGFAKALDKRIIGLIEEESWGKLPGYNPIPFDLFAISFTIYRKDDLENLRRILKKRIRKNKEIIEASQSV